MTASIRYVDVARFDAVDRHELVAASFACPWCLGVPSLGRIESATDEGFLELSCAPCDARWMVVVDSKQLLRLVAAPPRTSS
jgi:formate dehydrogenase maturation protein FdhE